MRFPSQATFIAILVCLCTLAPSVANAQAPAATGTLTGTVADPSGAVIPGAIIHIETHKPSTFTQPNSTSSDTGTYSIALPSGSYDVTIVAPGFDPFVGTAIIPRSGAVTRLNAALVIATDSEQVTVSSDQNSTSAAANKSALSTQVASPSSTTVEGVRTFWPCSSKLAGGSA